MVIAFIDFGSSLNKKETSKKHPTTISKYSYFWMQKDLSFLCHGNTFMKTYEFQYQLFLGYVVSISHFYQCLIIPKQLIIIIIQ